MSGEKTEAPTPQRLRQARERGQVARSRLLASSAVTLAAMAALFATVRHAATELSGLATRALGLELTSPGQALREASVTLASLAAPVLAAALLASVVASVAMSGWQLNPAVLAPQLSRLSPAAGFGRMFSRRALLELLKSAVAAAVVGFVCWRALADAVPDAARSVTLEGAAPLTAVLAVLRPGLWRGALALLVLGFADLALARRQHLRDLMMTRAEVKQEHRQAEGDPHHKAKRQSLHRQLAQGGPARGVAKATVVVVNPTHIAVALRYAPDEADAPYLVASGREADALALKAEAFALGIPVVKDVPLARSLIHLDVGEAIPEELYQAAAAIVRVALESSPVQPPPTPRSA
ncbi:MAG: EscU/YscU/HrcU family type III secretion system export apparatus switch protein [Myxococcaceae bacterium]|nr:EscU/YscU/HrcU family type III secretion system export apparatus switch protein [Myxococcaceae bacterium]